MITYGGKSFKVLYVRKDSGEGADLLVKGPFSVFKGSSFVVLSSS